MHFFFFSPLKLMIYRFTICWHGNDLDGVHVHYDIEPLNKDSPLIVERLMLLIWRLHYPVAMEYRVNSIE